MQFRTAALALTYKRHVVLAKQVAAVAQLGERETEDLKVTGSIPVRGTIFTHP